MREGMYDYLNKVVDGALYAMQGNEDANKV